MAISFQCTACDADFELEIPRIIERPTALKCPNCNARPPAHRCHALGTAVEDLLSAMAAIRTKVRFEISLDTEELPPPYGPAEASAEGGLTGAGDDLAVDDDEDADEDEEGDEESEGDEDEEGDEEDDEEESDSDDDFDLDEDDDEEEEEEEEEED
jgi:hypothetical protein